MSASATSSSSGGLREPGDVDDACAGLVSARLQGARVSAHQHDSIRLLGEPLRVDEIDDLGTVVAPGRRIQQHAFLRPDAQSPARRGAAPGDEHVVAWVAVGPDRPAEERVRLLQDALRVQVLREQRVPAPRLLDDGRHPPGVESGPVQRQTLERCAVPGLQHFLSGLADEAPSQPVVHDQQSCRSPGLPPFRAPLDDGDRSLRHPDRPVDDAPVPGDARCPRRDLVIERVRVAAGALPVEALEEHRVLVAAGLCRIALLEHPLPLGGLVHGIQRRCDRDDRAADRDAQPGQQPRLRLECRQVLTADVQPIPPRWQRQFGTAPPRNAQGERRLPRLAAAGDPGIDPRARTLQRRRSGFGAGAGHDQVLGLLIDESGGHRAPLGAGTARARMAW